MTELDDPTPHLRKPRNLAVDLVDLADATENNTWEMAYFLDLETGDVILLTEDAQRQHERLVAALGEMDRAQWAEAFEIALAESDVPDWERDMVRDAERVEAGFGQRYIRVPQAESSEGYADMEAFFGTVSNARLRDRLSRAPHSQGHDAFRRFKDVLLDAPAERERALVWLRSEGIEPGG